MGFFKGRKAQPPRRARRLWKQRALKFLSIGALTLTCSGLLFYGWKNDAPSRTHAWLVEKSIQTSAAVGFQVRDVLVRGRVRIDQNDILTRLDIQQGMPVFGIDLAAAQEKLEEISWAKTVQITRRLPGTIIIDIEERKPVALWQHQRKIRLIDETGAVLAADNLETYGSLPLIVGENAPYNVMEILALLQAEPTVAAQLESATRIGNRRWDLRLKNGINIHLPESNVELALRRLVTEVAQQDLFNKNITTIDLRLPDRLTLRLNQQEKNTGKNHI